MHVQYSGDIRARQIRPPAHRPVSTGPTVSPSVIAGSDALDDKVEILALRPMIWHREEPLPKLVHQPLRDELFHPVN